MPFYFEDEIGNKDTLILGYDTDASSGFFTLNEIYGEAEIVGPFDEDFEVRAMHNMPPGKMAKKLISHFSPSPLPNHCGSSRDELIIIRLKHPPLKITWDAALLEEGGCHTKSSFAVTEWWSTDWLVEDVPNWMTECFYGNNEYIYDFQNQYDPAWGATPRLDSIENVGIDTIHRLQMSFGDQDWPCSFLIDAVDEIERNTEQIKVYPNPTTDKIHFDEIEGRIDKIRLFDIIGKTIFFEKKLDKNELGIQYLQKGIYSGIIEDNSNQQYHFRFVKL